jgi:hypothetical protein
MITSLHLRQAMGQRTVLRRMRFTIANRMTAPSNEMSSAGRLQAKVALIDGAYAKQGRQQQAGQQRAHNPHDEIQHDALCAFVCIMMLATHSRVPPMITHSSKFIAITPLPCTVVKAALSPGFGVLYTPHSTANLLLPRSTSLQRDCLRSNVC